MWQDGRYKCRLYLPLCSSENLLTSMNVYFKESAALKLRLEFCSNDMYWINCILTQGKHSNVWNEGNIYYCNRDRRWHKKWYFTRIQAVLVNYKECLDIVIPPFWSCESILRFINQWLVGKWKKVFRQSLIQKGIRLSSPIISKRNFFVCQRKRLCLTIITF